jgi:hypothetical protein
MPETIQRSFTSGEIAPALQSRSDMTKYTTGLNLCENFIVRPQGGVYSRPGTRFIGELDDSTKRARLIPFQFNTEQTYILVFEEFKVRVIKNGGFVLASGGGSIFELATPYTESELPRLAFTQSADVMTLVHPNHDPRNLNRLADDNWALTVIDYSPPVTPPTFTSPITDDIVFITQANPAVVTTDSAHGFSNGQTITLSGVSGMTEVNGIPYTVANRTSGTFELSGIDSTGFSAYTQAAITNITQANPAVVTTAAPHGYSNGNEITIFDVVGMTEVNGVTYTIANVTANTFELSGINSTGFSAYTSDGIAALKTGTATVNTSAQPVGAGAGTYGKTYTYVITVVDENGIESLPSSEITITTKSLSVTAGVRLTWGAVAGASYYRIYKDPSTNSNIYGWIGDSKTTSFDDFNIAPIVTDAPPADRQPFTGVGNKPSAVNYYQQRQIFANTFNEPQSVYTTQVANYNSLRTSSPSRADDAVTLTIAGRQVNEIRHIVSLDSLILLTSGGEWIVSEGQDRVLTPSTVGVRVQSYNGSSWVPPVVINSTALYLQEKNARVRDLGYEFSSDKYTGSDLSLMSEHLFEGFTINEMAYADEPYGILWCVRDDGRMLGLTYQREHQVWGWHQHVTNGKYESIATIGEDQRDAVYLIVQREINGVNKRYVERMEPRGVTNSLDMFYVDSGLTYNGAPVDTLSGLDHLEGETVAVLADGVEIIGLTVTGGQVTLPDDFSIVHIGLPYTPAIETLDIDTGAQGETLKSKDLSVSKVFLEVEKSRGGWVGPRSTDVQNNIQFDMTEIKPRYDADGYDAIQPKTYKSEVIIDDHWDKSGGVRIEQRSPLPLAILSVIPEVDIGGS